MAKKETKEPKIDDLSDIISASLMKKFKDDVIIMTDEHDSPSDIRDYVSTGSDVLDLIISNRPNGGIPCGRITEIFGDSGSGKSLLAAHILAETQKRGGIAVLIDTEAAISREFLEAIGVQLTGPNKLMVLPVETIERAFDLSEHIINTARESNKDRLVTIVIDSLAGASTELEMDATYSKDGYATGKALILSKAMRKITNLIAKQRICMALTNQIRQKLNAMAYADPHTTSGGMGVKFHCSVRIKLASVGAIKRKDDYGIEHIAGNKTKAKIVKNRIGPPSREANYSVYYDSGIDKYSGWIETLVLYKILRQAGNQYKYGDSVQFMAKDFTTLMNSKPELKKELYDKMCEVLIMKYKHNGEVMMDENTEIDETILEGTE